MSLLRISFAKVAGKRRWDIPKSTLGVISKWAFIVDPTLGTRRRCGGSATSEEESSIARAPVAQTRRPLKRCFPCGRHRSRSRYQSSINNLVRHIGERIRLADITPETVFIFQQKRLADGAGKATTNRDVATLSALMSHAKRMRLVSHNPCSDVGRLNERRDRRQAEPFSYDEEARVRQCSPLWLAVLITLLVETGLRVAKEALPLKWSDVFLDSDPACIHVRDSKSKAGVRAVWLTKHCKETLLRWRATAGPEFSPYVFPSPRIPGTHIRDYKKAWQTAIRKAGLKGRRAYDTRATFASRANSCKASGLTVAHLLGHASTQILPTYVKPLDENTKAVIEALDAARLSVANRLGSIQ